MRTILFTSFFALNYWGFGQTEPYRNFEITYDVFGLGSSLGDSSRVFSVTGTQIESKVRHFIHDKDVTIHDTIGLNYVLYDSSYYILPKNGLSTLRESSIDSMINILLDAKAKRKRLGGTNSCVRSGSAHYMTISGDSIGSVLIAMYNSFDSTAFELTNILLDNMHPNTLDFRPLKMWEHAIKCRESWKKRMAEYEGLSQEEKLKLLKKDREERNRKREKPIDRRDAIQEAVREELNND